MSDCCTDQACAIEALKARQSSTLRIVLAINVALFKAALALLIAALVKYLFFSRTKQ